MGEMTVGHRMINVYEKPLKSYFVTLWQHGGKGKTCLRNFSGCHGNAEKG